MKTRNILLMALSVMVLSGCSKFLDRQPKTDMNDQTYWTSENKVRLFANGFYENYFVGYNSYWTVDYTPVRGYNFNDDLTSIAKQTLFENAVPTSRGSYSESAEWMQNYAGPTWNFAWVRKSNLMLERVKGMKDTYLNEEAYNHWTAVARFFRGYEYSRLVSVFGDVPYYGRVLKDNETDLLYKDRDKRTDVMDSVAADFEYVLENMRYSDGNAQYLNRYIAAAFISRFMLFEGTWQKYHENNTEKAKEYLELAVKAADLVMQSGKYKFTSDFRSLFGSEDLGKNEEVIMYRHYDAALVTHHIASYSDLFDGQPLAANLDLIKSFICNDGKVYSQSSAEGAANWDLTSLIKSRDPRFEATFYNKPTTQASTLLYSVKFVDREGPKFYEMDGKPFTDKYKSNTNTNDAPVIRYAEVVLNWIEAKAELAEMGGTAITQDDLDASINAIRLRPLDETAIANGAKQTAPMSLSAIPSDPDKDADVSDLIWEIRRERRMEFFFEHTRLLDLKRWKKLDYMSGAKNPDILRGLYVNIPEEIPDLLDEGKIGVLRVETLDGNVITYDGNNGDQMVGFYIPENVQDRDEFTERVYLAPIGMTQMAQYEEKGYKLTQTKLW